MEQVILVALGINVILSAFFAFCSRKKGKRIWLTLFFLVLPYVGFLLCFIPEWIVSISEKTTFNREIFVKKEQVDQIQKLPDVNKELNIIPIEDAMAVGSNGEKRDLLLAQMKKGMEVNYKVILPAGVDSESAHYVATARMEINRQKHGKLMELQRIVKKNPTDITALHAYLNELAEYVEIGVLEAKEADIYREEYCTYFMKLHRLDTDGISATEIARYLQSLIFINETEEAEDLWKVCPEDKRNEVSYKVMLNMYYDKRDKAKFFKCLKELEESEVSLSPEGLMLLRFWIARREQ